MLNIVKIFIFIILPTQLWSASTWNQKADFGGVARHRASGFSISGKGYIGLGHINSAEHIVYKDFWEYDPATNSWTQKADFGGGERYQATSFVIGKIGYLGAGRSHPLDIYEKDFWAFNPLANMWFPITELPGVERRGAVGFSIDGKGYVGLGQTNGGYATDFYEYDPETDMWTQKADFIGSGRTSAVSFVHNGKAYVGTGHEWGAAVKDFYEFTPSSNFWVQKTDVGDSLRQDATGFVLNGKGYIGTGNNVDGSVNYKDFWRYDFETGIWTQIEDFKGVARRYMVSFVIGNTAYSGTGTNGTNLKDFWAYDPTLNTSKNEIDFKNPYPNPSNSTINFECPLALLDNNSILTIYNVQGQIVKQILIKSNLIQLNKQNFENGSYLYQITSNNAIFKQGKIMFTE